MSFSPVPHYTFRELLDVSPEFLKELGVKFLMVDLDNTVAAYNEHEPAENISQWVAVMKENGVELFIVSNSLKKRRVAAFAKSLGISYINGASKPSPKGVIKAMAAAGFNADNTALVGDQVYTDTLAANRAGIVSIVVRPRRFTNPFLAFRYAMEAPFRAACKSKAL